jgi:ketosteroid isomerase-like protein
MHRIILRIGVTLVTFIVGVSLTGAWNFLFGTSSRDGSALGAEEALSCPPSDSPASDTQELRKIYDQYAVAQTEHDATFFEQNEAEDFILFEPYGKNLSRTEDIELLRTLDPQTKYTIDDLHVQLRGDAAVVTGRMTATFPSGGSYSWPWIDVCVRRNGRWQILSTTQVN